MLSTGYNGTYTYCYCTKSSHFRHILRECLKNDVHLELSAGFDVAIVRSLAAEGQLPYDRMIVCNGFKSKNYLQGILALRKEGFERVIPVIDNKEEFEFFAENAAHGLELGLRIAIEEQPDFEVYTSRLGMPRRQILEFYEQRIRHTAGLKVTMLHFFTQSGIDDTPYFWNEFRKAVELYTELAQRNPHLRYLNIGGGLPYRNSLFFEFDYPYMITEMVNTIKNTCAAAGVREPDIVSEFGSFTVSEASGVLFGVEGRKYQNDREAWLMLDGSLMCTLPDIWALKQRYILLPINNWDAGYERVILGGNTCDNHDYYERDAHTDIIFLPKSVPEEKQYIGFFHTGAYQEALSGVGGIHHCLIPTPRHILIDGNAYDGFTHEVLTPQQQEQEVMSILGYQPASTPAP